MFAAYNWFASEASRSGLAVGVGVGAGVGAAGLACVVGAVATGAAPPMLAIGWLIDGL